MKEFRNEDKCSGNKTVRISNLENIIVMEGKLQ